MFLLIQNKDYKETFQHERLYSLYNHLIKSLISLPYTLAYRQLKYSQYQLTAFQDRLTCILSLFLIPYVLLKSSQHIFF